MKMHILNGWWMAVLLLMPWCHRDAPGSCLLDETAAAPLNKVAGRIGDRCAVCHPLLTGGWRRGRSRPPLLHLDGVPEQDDLEPHEPELPNWRCREKGARRILKKGTEVLQKEHTCARYKKTCWRRGNSNCMCLRDRQSKISVRPTITINAYR
jgi:hypothetical protein